MRWRSNRDDKTKNKENDQENKKDCDKSTAVCLNLAQLRMSKLQRFSKAYSKQIYNLSPCMVLMQTYSTTKSHSTKHIGILQMLDFCSQHKNTIPERGNSTEVQRKLLIPALPNNHSKSQY